MYSGERPKPAHYLLLLPVLALLAVFLASVALLFSNAFSGGSGFSLQYFQQILDRTDYQIAFLRTFVASVAIAVIATVLSYPVAMLLWRADRWRNLLLIVVLVPWLVSLVIRTYGWIVLLGPKGVINGMLQWLGLLDQPVKLMFNDTGLVIGLVHVLMPFGVISILSSLLNIEDNLEEASRVLGARPWQTLTRIVLPLSLPGAFTALIVIFLASMGAIVTPILLGGVSQKFVGTQIYQEVMYAFNMNKAAAWALCLLVISLLGLLALKAIERRVLRNHE